MVCKQCGEKLNTEGKRGQKCFCSISCSVKYRKGEHKKGIYIPCETCGKGVFSPNWRPLRFCSTECYFLFKTKNKVRTERKCDCCNKAFKVIESRDSARFCSNECKFNSQKGVNHPSHKGGRVIRSFPTKSGHVSKYWIARDERTSNNKCEKLEHRIIVELAIGRKLKRSEIVHHINCDTLDNRKSNLLLCDQSYHAYLHNRMSHLYAKKFL